MTPDEDEILSKVIDRLHNRVAELTLEVERLKAQLAEAGDE